MLAAVIAADPRLYGKLGGTRSDLNAVYGIGYDANGDGLVNGVDLGIWESRYGLPPATGAIGAVPEPAACGLLAVGLLALAGMRRRGA